MYTPARESNIYAKPGEYSIANMADYQAGAPIGCCQTSNNVYDDPQYTEPSPSPPPLPPPAPIFFSSASDAAMFQSMSELDQHDSEHSPLNQQTETSIQSPSTADMFTFNSATYAVPLPDINSTLGSFAPFPVETSEKPAPSQKRKFNPLYAGTENDLMASMSESTSSNNNLKSNPLYTTETPGRVKFRAIEDHFDRTRDPNLHCTSLMTEKYFEIEQQKFNNKQLKVNPLYAASSGEIKPAISKQEKRKKQSSRSRRK